MTYMIPNILVMVLLHPSSLQFNKVLNILYYFLEHSLLKLTNINEVEYNLSMDLKLVNICIDISGHS